MRELSISSLSSNKSSSQALLRAGDYISKKNLVGGMDRVLCMVSGGADSVAMLNILQSLSISKKSSFPGGFTLGICHVNYGRRATESDADESFVRGLGDSMGIPVHTLRAPGDKRSNFQAWARDFRYLAAQNLCRWQGYTRIAVGHNKDDRIETFIYRLLTYSGRRSLVVMPPRRGRVIRPLLFMTSNEIRDYCRVNGLDWREDDSNKSLDYARNRIRQNVTPRLEEIQPDFRDRITDTLALLEDEDEILDSVTDEAWHAAAKSEEGQTTLSAFEISLLPKAVARLVMRRWLSNHGGQLRLSRRLLDSLVDLCSDQSGSSSISLSDDLQVERQYDRLLLAAAGSNTGSAMPQTVILPVPGKVDFGDFVIEAADISRQDVSDEEISSLGPMEALLDSDVLKSPLKVRSWHAGDRFNPLGFQGSKSIQDLFTDEKIPKNERDHIPIVTAASGIVWVCGLRVSEKFKVAPESVRLIRLNAARRKIDNRV
ncbi:MAG: tRNA lysidine(34) synthetase TilS [Thermoleophilia bacterium]|jgi:tRNA(Ile)-lysidine synthase